MRKSDRTRPSRRSAADIQLEATLLFAHHARELGFRFETEFRFHETRKWLFDFKIFRSKDDKVAIEIEGGIWTRGRHTTGIGFQRDLDKYNAATAAGWAVFRFSVEDVNKGRDLTVLRAWLALQKVTSTVGC